MHHPYYNKDIKHIESIQNRAMRFTVNDYTSTQTGFTTQMRSKLNLDTLHHRREVNRLALYYKVVNGHIPAISPKDYLTPVRTRRKVKPVQYSDFLSSNTVDKSATNNSQCFRYSFGKTEQYRNSFFIRTTLAWNQLDDNTIHLPTADKFKSAVSATLKH